MSDFIDTHTYINILNSSTYTILQYKKSEKNANFNIDTTICKPVDSFHWSITLHKITKHGSPKTHKYL